MSIWRRAPRQVYRVYGEEEYLAEERVADGLEVPHDVNAEDLREENEVGAHAARGLSGPSRSGGGGARERPSELGRARSIGSRTPRLVGVGLLLGVTVGAAGLVLAHLTHEASSARGGGRRASIVRHMPPASAGSFPRRASGVATASHEVVSRSGDRPASRVSAPGHAPSNSVPERHASGIARARPAESGSAAGARMTAANRGAQAARLTDSQASAAAAAAGEEFDFEGEDR